MAEAYLSLGGNVGDRRALIDEAVVRLGQLAGIVVTGRSSYYCTAPVGPIAQDWFLNIAVALQTNLTPPVLRTACREIETALGRDPAAEIPWGPRKIDIDVVFVTGDRESHPELTRGYLIVPLAEIAGEARIGGRRISDLLAAADVSGVERLAWPVPE